MPGIPRNRPGKLYCPSTQCTILKRKSNGGNLTRYIHRATHLIVEDELGHIVNILETMRFPDAPPSQWRPKVSDLPEVLWRFGTVYRRDLSVARSGAMKVVRASWIDASVRESIQALCRNFTFV